MADYQKGNIVKGCVTGIEPYGVFVSLDEYYKGLIHISEISDSFVKNINDLVKVGDTIFAKVLEVDDDTFQLKLSIKNINYKEDGKRTRRPIKETGLGFEPLAQNRDKWVLDKIVEIDKKI